MRLDTLPDSLRSEIAARLHSKGMK
jgi:hypothetical protein